MVKRNPCGLPTIAAALGRRLARGTPPPTFGRGFGRRGAATQPNFRPASMPTTMPATGGGYSLFDFEVLED